MSLSLRKQVVGETAVSPTLKTLISVGAAAPLLTFVFYVSEFLFIPWDRFPTSTEEWFALFQRSKLLGLFYLNALDIVSITLLGMMFLALYVVLKQINESRMIIATFFGLLGVTAFVVPRVLMLSMLPLSDRYVAATTEIERVRLLAAGETLGALGTPTPQTIGFLFMAIGVFLISLVMLKSERFSKITAYLGVVASLFTFADQISIVSVPALATPLMIISGLFWIPWWLLISRSLFQVARRQPQKSIGR
jgi:hypothetical protein